MRCGLLPALMLSRLSSVYTAYAKDKYIQSGKHPRGGGAPHYSYRSATMGSSAAARCAG